MHDASTLLILLGCCVLCVLSAQRAHDAHGWRTQALGLVVSIASVAIPGRFDSDVDPANMSFPWPTLFAPAGFAFAIWGIIYAGEVVGMIALLTNDEVVSHAAPAARAWLCANVAQALWCASFRPWALDRLWLSAAALATTAFCLYTSQRELVTRGDPPGGSLLLWRLVVWPRSLHCGWLAAATLVNVNAFVGKAALGPPAALAALVLSLLAASSLGDALVASGLPLAAVSVAWGLFAVSKGEPVGADAAALGKPALDGLALSAAAASLLVLLSVVARPALEAAAANPSGPPSARRMEALGSPAPAQLNKDDVLAFAARQSEALSFAPAPPPAK